jgi:hypothetical protein
MQQRVDRLRSRCQELLGEKEDILLEAEATCKLGLLNEFGAGRAYLTNRRIIWIRRSTPLLRPLLFWIPDVVAIERTSIDQIRMVRDLTRAWLSIGAGGKTYALRLGKGPYPTLRDNPKTTEEWLHALEGARPTGVEPPGKAPAACKPERNRAGILMIGLAILSTPLWVAGFLLSGAPLALFVIMCLLTGIALVIGLVLCWGRSAESSDN